MTMKTRSVELENYSKLPNLLAEEIKQITQTKFSYVSVSDIHLGHPRTHAQDTIASLNKYITNREYLASIDVLVIVGDLFDRGLRFNEDVIPYIERWVFKTLSDCAATNTMLWILEGTPSHDREQSEIFIRYNTMFNIGCQIRYIDKPTIFYEHRFGAHFLFIPDGEANTDLTWEITNQLLAENGITQVDFGFIHGAFRYQLPEVANTPKHVEERYLSIVRHIINTGHIHRASEFDRIRSNGSFDRVDHNYESPKGFWRVDYDNHETTCTFVQNHDAKIYKTIDCRGLTVEEALTKVHLTIADSPIEDSYFRIWAKEDDAVLSHMGEIKRKYKLFNWSSPKQESVNKIQIGDQAVNDDRIVKLSITPKSLPDILRERMANKKVDSTLINAVLQIVEELGAA